MKLSIIIPTFNEANHVRNLLDRLLQMSPKEKEIFIVDGGSMDGTVDIVKEISKRNPIVQLVRNSDRFVSQGFNKAFPQTSGTYVSLIGAHTKYPKNYFQIAIDILEQNEADVIGGNLQHRGVGLIGKTIARCMSSRFGVGGVQFRTSSKKQFVDTVPFAIYKREIFERIGLFDESLIRNQDDELHYRIAAKGYRILMNPAMKTEYFVRPSLMKLFSQYFQYGFFKPFVLKKVKSGAKIRHFLPLFFVLYILSLPLAVIFPIWLSPMFLYILLNIGFSVVNQKSLMPFMISFVVYLILHLSYGLGFLFGLFRVLR